MGEAIVGGLLATPAGAGFTVVVAEPSADRRAALSQRFGVPTVAQGQEAVSGSDAVLLAVKPQVIDSVVAALAPAIEKGALIISIAAGVTCARLESLLPEGTPVVRVMPNTPALVGAAMSVVSGGSESTAVNVADVEALFGSIGDVAVVEERYQDACSAISGSGPAYVALVVDALARAGVREGLTRDLAQRLALQTLRGTVELITRTGEHPEAVIDAVSSPGGSTIAAINELEKAGVRSAFAAAVRAAVARSRELGM
jgi:pyrroline-5-carboxylate reductase